MKEYSKSEIENGIDEWIIGRNAKRNRLILKLKLIDGLSYTEACEAEEAYSNAMEGRYSREDRASYADNSYGYSRSDSNLHGQLYRLMETSKDPRTKEEIRNLLERI